MTLDAQKTGFTLVELLMAVVASAILALVVGIMLVYAWGEFRRDRDGVNMQEDGRIAMETIARTIRSASAPNVQVLSSNDLRVTSSGVTKRVYASGNSLFYDPNMAVAGDAVSLVNNRLISFIALTTNSTSVQVTLTLTAGDNTHNETILGVFTCRN